MGSLRSFVSTHPQPSPMKSSKKQIYIPLRDLPLQLILSMLFLYASPGFVLFCFKRHGFTLWTQTGLKLSV